MNIGQHSQLMYNGEIYEYFSRYRVKDHEMVKAIEAVNAKYGFCSLVSEWYSYLFQEGGFIEFEDILLNITDPVGTDLVLTEVCKSLESLHRYLEYNSTEEIENAIKRIRNKNDENKKMGKMDFLILLGDRWLCHELGIEDGDDQNYLAGYVIQDAMIMEYKKEIDNLKDQIKGVKRTSFFDK